MKLLRRSVLFAFGSAAVAFAFPRRAFAQPPEADLMSRLAQHAAHFETMKTHASFTIAGKLEEVGADGAPKNAKEMTAQVTADGTKLHFDVLRYVEDGQDKTAEAQQKAKEKAAEKKPESNEKKRDVRMPFHTGEQPRYVFDQVEVDANDPTRVRISFVPKIKEDDTIEGSAWVDTQSGTVLSAGFKLSKPPTAIDYVNVQLSFGANTSLGPAISRIDIEGAGGILFVRKHFRGTATLSNHTIVP
jgi:hypothetical protein